MRIKNYSNRTELSIKTKDCQREKGCATNDWVESPCKWKRRLEGKDKTGAEKREGWQWTSPAPQERSRKAGLFWWPLFSSKVVSSLPPPHFQHLLLFIYPVFNLMPLKPWHYFHPEGLASLSPLFLNRSNETFSFNKEPERSRVYFMCTSVLCLHYLPTPTLLLN